MELEVVGGTFCYSEDGAFVVGMINLLGEATFVSTCGFPRARKLGSLGMRPRIARAMFDFDDETPLRGSRISCFNFLWPLILRANSSTWLWIFSTSFLPNGDRLNLEWRLSFKFCPKFCSIAIANRNYCSSRFLYGRSFWDHADDI